jgi:hypothetical protein
MKPSSQVSDCQLLALMPTLVLAERVSVANLTGLFLLAHHLTQENYEAVMSEARGQSRRQIEQLIAARCSEAGRATTAVPTAAANFVGFHRSSRVEHLIKHDE